MYFWWGTGFILLNDIWTCYASASQLRLPAMLLLYLHSQETTPPHVIFNIFIVPKTAQIGYYFLTRQYPPKHVLDYITHCKSSNFDKDQQERWWNIWKYIITILLVNTFSYHKSIIKYIFCYIFNIYRDHNHCKKFWIKKYVTLSCPTEKNPPTKCLI